MGHGSYRLLCIKHQVFVELDEVGEGHLIPGFHLLWDGWCESEIGAETLGRGLKPHSPQNQGLTTSLSRRNLMLGTR